MGRLEGYLKYRRAKHSEKLRARNLKSGKKKTKGWGKMVDTGFGGLNNLNPVDTKEFIKEEQGTQKNERKFLDRSFISINRINKINNNKVLLLVSKFYFL